MLPGQPITMVGLGWFSPAPPKNLQFSCFQNFLTLQVLSSALHTAVSCCLLLVVLAGTRTVIQSVVLAVLQWGKPCSDQGCRQFCSKILWTQYDDLTPQFFDLLYLALTTEVVTTGSGCKMISSLCFHSIYQWQPQCLKATQYPKHEDLDYSFFFQYIGSFILLQGRGGEPLRF